MRPAPTRWDVAAAEGIACGPETAREVIVQRLIDDGVLDRGHRDNIFDPRFGVAGAAGGPHAPL